MALITRKDYEKAADYLKTKPAQKCIKARDYTLEEAIALEVEGLFAGRDEVRESTRISAYNAIAVRLGAKTIVRSRVKEE